MTLLHGAGGSVGEGEVASTEKVGGVIVDVSVDEVDDGDKVDDSMEESVVDVKGVGDGDGVPATYGQFAGLISPVRATSISIFDSTSTSM